MKNVTVLIKPVSSMCNMSCRYCFYKDEAQRRAQAFQGIMSDETAENTIKKFLAFAGESCHFTFQGGEPTLAGTDFYRKFLAFEKKHNVNGVTITHSIQTNGLALTKKDAAFYKENGFLIGLSIDGAKELHDRNRITPDGKGTFDRVMKTAKMLQSIGAEFNVLSVVTDESTEKGAGLTAFFARRGIKYLQYIPCLDACEGKRPAPDKYARFLTQTMECLPKIKPAERPRVRHIDNLIAMLYGREPESCDMRGVCTVQFVIEGGGNVYPCDFYCTDEYLLGNINENSPDELLNCEKAVHFTQESTVLPEDCRACEYLAFCRNGCRRDRIDGKTVYCESYKKYYGEVLRKK